MTIFNRINIAMKRRARYDEVRAELGRLTPSLIEDAGLGLYDFDEIANRAARAI